MNELLALLSQFRDCLEQQMRLYSELVPVIDREEDMLTRFDVGAFEKVVVEKDQLVRRAQACEERRLALVKRICFMIAFDARGQLPSLRTFLAVFESYCARVATLIDAPTREALEEHRAALQDIAARYFAAFKVIAPRVHRNQIIMRKMARNFERSLSIMQSEANVPSDYDATGKTTAKVLSKDGLSSVRVKA